jgi:hypothetical protein
MSIASSSGLPASAPCNPIFQEIIQYMLRTGHAFRDYDVNCTALYAIVRRHVPIEIGRSDCAVGNRHLGKRLAMLWHSRGADGRYGAYRRGTPILVETNPLHPYPRRQPRPTRAALCRWPPPRQATLGRTGEDVADEAAASAYPGYRGILIVRARARRSSMLRGRASPQIQAPRIRAQRPTGAARDSLGLTPGRSASK